MKLPEQYNIGSIENLKNKDGVVDPEKLIRLLQDMYKQLAQAINFKPDLYERGTDGQAGDIKLSNGTININTSTLKVEMLTEHSSPTTVTWTQLS